MSVERAERFCLSETTGKGLIHRLVGVSVELGQGRCRFPPPAFTELHLVKAKFRKLNQ